MQQADLFSETVDVAPKRKVHLSWNDNQTELLRTILTVYNNCEGIYLDATYSIGEFYKHLPEPVLKFDLDPQLPGIERADCRSLPLADNSIPSMMIDLPFLTGNSKDGAMKRRFTKLPNMRYLQELYEDSIKEAYRVLISKGLLVFKCQAVVSGARKHPVGFWVQSYAFSAGFVYEDECPLVRNKPMTQAHTQKNGQQHPQSGWSSFFVFRKGRLSIREQRERAWNSTKGVIQNG